MLILAFEANSALSRENDTKIVKITHSAPPAEYLCRYEEQKVDDLCIMCVCTEKITCLFYFNQNVPEWLCSILEKII